VIAATMAPAPAEARRGGGNILTGILAAGVISALVASNSSARAGSTYASGYGNSNAYPPSAYGNGAIAANPRVIYADDYGNQNNTAPVYIQRRPVMQAYPQPVCARGRLMMVQGYPTPVCVKRRPMVVQAYPTENYGRRMDGRDFQQNRPYRDPSCMYGSNQYTGNQSGRC
jgi:hypothetical protein